MALDEAHELRKAELEEQIKNGSTDPNVKSELEAIEALEAEGQPETNGAEQTQQPSAGAKPSQPQKGGNQAKR